MKITSMSHPIWVSAFSSSEMPAHLTRREFRLFLCAGAVRMVLVLVSVAQMVSEFPSGLGILGSALTTRKDMGWELKQCVSVNKNKIQNRSNIAGAVLLCGCNLLFTIDKYTPYRIK